MRHKTVTFLIFATGVAVGSVAARQHFQKKYERIAQEEIDSVKEIFSKRNTQTIADRAKDKPDVTKCAANLHKREPINAKKSKKSAYIITPDEFGDQDDYEAISLTYYADHILTDDNNDLVEDVEAIVGFESLSHFGEYEDDSVFVRNDTLKCDYEILQDHRKYADVVRKPYEN